MYEVHQVKVHILEYLVKTRRDGSYEKTVDCSLFQSKVS